MIKKRWGRQQNCIQCEYVAQWKRICLLMQEAKETQAWSLDRENPLEGEMATHSSILAWKIPWTEEPGGIQFMGLQRVGHN